MRFAKIFEDSPVRENPVEPRANSLTEAHVLRDMVCNWPSPKRGEGLRAMT
jgi:hypothetical protein